MGFIVRLHEPSESRPSLIGRVPTALDAFTLLRQWRTDHPDAWVEVVPARLSPSGTAA